MTGEKNRYSSVEKLWKLDDETLKTPVHDEMVLYLLDKENLKSIKIFRGFLEEREQLVNQLKENENKYYKHIENISMKIESEVPIMTERNFLVGYFDVVITLFDLYDDIQKNYERNIARELHYLMKNSFQKYSKIRKISIEVKPYISSFGATLRQLRTYQEYCPECKGNLILFTRDSCFKNCNYPCYKYLFQFTNPPYFLYKILYF